MRLHEGKDADYLVFEKSLMEMDPKEIRDTMPESVYLCGELYQD